MIGSLTIAERRMHELLARYGAGYLDAAASQLLNYSERFMRAEIREIPTALLGRRHHGRRRNYHSPLHHARQAGGAGR